MKLLIIGMTSFPGGMETYIMNMYKYLEKDKYKCTFINECSEPIAYEDEIKKAGGEIISIPSRNKNFLKHYIGIYRLFKKNKFNVIYYNTLSLANIDYVLMSGKNTKRIIHAHNPETADGIRGILKNFHRRLIPKIGDVFFACSKSAGESFFGNQKFHVIKNAIEVQQFKYEVEKAKKVKEKLNLENHIVIGTVGRIAYQKNSLFIVDIFSEFYKKYPNAIFLHIGDGELRDELERKIEEKKLKGKYLILGKQQDTSIFYQVFDAFLFPSLYEGLGIVCIEAQAAGVPCIVSETIPEEVDVGCNLIHSVSLDKTAKQWAQEIEKYCFSTKKDTSFYVEKAGYDAKKNIAYIKKLIE